MACKQRHYLGLISRFLRRHSYGGMRDFRHGQAKSPLKMTLKMTLEIKSMAYKIRQEFLTTSKKTWVFLLKS